MISEKLVSVSPRTFSKHIILICVIYTACGYITSTVVLQDTSVSPYEPLGLRAQNTRENSPRYSARVTRGAVVTLRASRRCIPLSVCAVLAQQKHFRLHLRFSVIFFFFFCGLQGCFNRFIPGHLVESKTVRPMVACWQAATTYTHACALPGFALIWNKYWPADIWHSSYCCSCCWVSRKAHFSSFLSFFGEEGG